MKSIAFGGLDVHSNSVAVCLLGSSGDAVLDQRSLPFEEGALCKYFRRLKERYDLRLCYEASGCGYVLHRWLKDLGIGCEVIAPSLIPMRPGSRVKTDKRDALKLARLYRAGELTPVHVPTEQEESIRALVRCRETLIKEVVQSKNYLLKFLKLRGLAYSGTKSNWTQKHWAWLRSLTFEGVDRVVFMEYLTLLDYKLLRVADLDRELEALARSEPYKQAVDRLCCLRGIGTQTAMVLLSETIDFKRFGRARYLMSYFGLCPSEDSSGETRRRGSITKAGNARCRRALVEAAWKYRHAPSRSAALTKRLVGQPAEVVSLAWKAQHRLHKRFWHIALRKEKQKAVVAVARELAGFVWAVMRDADPTKTAAPAPQAAAFK